MPAELGRESTSGAYLAVGGRLGALKGRNGSKGDEGHAEPSADVGREGARSGLTPRGRGGGQNLHKLWRMATHLNLSIRMYQHTAVT